MREIVHSSDLALCTPVLFTPVLRMCSEGSSDCSWPGDMISSDCSWPGDVHVHIPAKKSESFKIFL